MSGPHRHCNAHLGIEALKHAAEDIRLYFGQHQLTRGLRSHVPIAQDQRTLHSFYFMLTSVLGGREISRIAGTQRTTLHTEPCLAVCVLYSKAPGIARASQEHQRQHPGMAEGQTRCPHRPLGTNWLQRRAEAVGPRRKGEV